MRYIQTFIFFFFKKNILQMSFLQLFCLHWWVTYSLQFLLQAAIGNWVLNTQNQLEPRNLPSHQKTVYSEQCSSRGWLCPTMHLYIFVISPRHPFCLVNNMVVLYTGGNIHGVLQLSTL